MAHRTQGTTYPFTIKNMTKGTDDHPDGRDVYGKVWGEGEYNASVP